MRIRLLSEAMVALRKLSCAWNRLAWGLSGKVSLFVCILLTTFTTVFITVNIIAEQGVVQDRLKREARSIATMLADFASNYLADLRIDELRIIVQDVQRREDIIYAYVLDPEDSLIVDGEVGDDNLFDTIDDPLSRAARESGRGSLVLDRDGLHAVEPVYLGAQKLGTVRIGMSTEQLRQDIDSLRDRNTVLGVGFLFIGLVLSLPLVRRITRPLALLKASTEAASQGRFEQQIEIRTNDEIGMLAAAFNRMLRQLRDHTERARHLAFFDSVTDLPNRVHFKELLGRAIASARRDQHRGAVLFLDLDRFKLINDTFGHDAGDLLLRSFAVRLTNCLRAVDVVARPGAKAPDSTLARLGGDEFTIMLGEIHGPADAARVARRVLEALDQPFDLGGQTVVVGTSIGVAIFPDDGDDPESLLKNADVAMYHAKEQGRNNYQFYSRSLGARTVARLTLERDLRKALVRGEFELQYQPQLALGSRAVVGLEALVRWHHPRLGVVSPATFISLAEETRLIVPVGIWVLRQACREASAWSRAGLGPLRIAVNLSVVQVLQNNFVGQLAAVLAETGLAPERLELEITETTVMSDAEAVVAKLIEVKRMGVTLAIDDFGTGHSSLSYLKRFPLDRLKIDRSFIRDIACDADDEAIVTAIIAMSRSLSFEVVAEGIETARQEDFLRRQGCDLAQGFLFSPPLPAKDVPGWLLAWQRKHEGEPLPARLA
ncbi:MAG: putative bifunctional diguanylate cyclase/phosphodiesterase [Geminicoccaceae bacterium]